MPHYYTNDVHEHDYQTITYDINHKSYTFTTDAGVFSRGGVDFGTNLLIETILGEQPAVENFIDMGSGYGVISVVLADQLGIQGTAVDVNINALELTNKNDKHHTVTTMVRDDYNASDITADLYVTNPPFRAGKTVVLEIIEDGFNRLHENGVFFMVVQKKQGMPSYKKAIDAKFGNVSVLAKSKGYYILSAKKNQNE